MKKDIIEYLTDSFIDFKGDRHYVTVCVVTSTPVPDYGDDRLMVLWYNGDSVDESSDIYHDVYRAVNVGVTICCPNDTYDEEVGKKIAYKRALNTTPKLVSLEKGVINSTLVSALLKQEVEFIKKYPGKFIKGYDEAKARYDSKEALNNSIKNLTNAEMNVVSSILDGIDINKCIKIASHLKAKNETIM